jgi:hypothetical protein
MELDGLLILAAVWFLLNLITKAKSKPAPGPRPPVHTPVEPRSLPSAPDPTQQEGSRLELVLRELQRSLEEAAGVPDRTPLPSEQQYEKEQYEEQQSLEAEPEIISLEGEVHREARRRVDQDDDAAEIEDRRFKAAEARYSARSQASRIIEETQIKQEPADHTATRGYSAKQLRDAVVWREILGPPVSER